MILTLLLRAGWKWLATAPAVRTTLRILLGILLVVLFVSVWSVSHLSVTIKHTSEGVTLDGIMLRLLSIFAITLLIGFGVLGLIFRTAHVFLACPFTPLSCSLPVLLTLAVRACFWHWSPYTATVFVILFVLTTYWVLQDCRPRRSRPPTAPQPPPDATCNLFGISDGLARTFDAALFVPMIAYALFLSWNGQTQYSCYAFALLMSMGIWWPHTVYVLSGMILLFAAFLPRPELFLATSFPLFWSWIAIFLWYKVRPWLHRVPQSCRQFIHSQLTYHDIVQ